MMDQIDVENAFPRQTSLLFGDALMLDDEENRKTGSKRLVRYAKFWYWFRTTLVITAPVLFISTFLVAYFFFNTTDGFIFIGSLLSVLFCALALLSYFHVRPWRRHPSILMAMICFISSIMSSILLFNAAPYAGTREISDASDINLIGTSTYSSARDHNASCVIMSFFIQLTLLAREGWILTLSVDLLTTITNPFSSHKSSVNRYHFYVWMGTLLSAVILVGQRSCQGEFLTNGTCWIKISGPDSLCFWGYLMSWVILFYVNAGAVLTYAFRRISSGLESTYATRFACVADTFRVVFLYFAYGMLLAVFFLVLFYATENEVDEQQLFFLEHVFAYLIACRGFFDALIWFFSHGFVSTGAVTNMAMSRSRLSLTRGASLKLANNKGQSLTMKEVLMPRAFLSCCRYLFTSSNKTHSNSNDLRQTLIDEEDEDDPATAAAADAAGDDEEKEVEEEETEEQLRESRRPFAQETETLASARLRQYGSPTTTNNTRSEQKKEAAADSGGRSGFDGSGSGRGRGGIDISSASAAAVSSSRSHRTSNSSLRMSLSNNGGIDELDTSPQLNQALREEVLSLVTQGVKEAANRMIEREQRLLTLLQSAVARDTLVEEVSSHDTNNTRQISKEEQAEFARVRIDSAAAINTTDSVSNAAYSSYTNNTASYAAPSASHNHSHRSGRYNNAIHGLMSVVGSYLPGEYGVDPLVNSMRSQHQHQQQQQQQQHVQTQQQGQHSPMAPPGISTNELAEEEEEDGDENDVQDLLQQSQSQSQASSAAVHHELSRSIISEQSKLLQELQTPPAEVVFLLNNSHRFRDFRPATFKRLRTLSGLTEERYLELISAPGTQERLSEGRSGAFFFLCGDSELVIKTVSHSEARTLLRILDDYHDHLVKHEDSLLVRFIGLHEICLYGNAFAFVVMKNIFPPKIRLSETYDLKGSYVARHAASTSNNGSNNSSKGRNKGKIVTCRHCGAPFIEGGDPSSSSSSSSSSSNDLCPEVVGAHEASRTLKDNDLRSKIRLYPAAALTILEAVRADSDALCRMGLTDYSLLVGVKTSHFSLDARQQQQQGQAGVGGGLSLSPPRSFIGGVSPPEDTVSMAAIGGSRSAFPARAVIAPAEYYFGIIDILQTWDISKRIERIIKKNIFGQDGDGISCMAPRPFSRRFQRKMMSVIDHAAVVREVTGSWQGRREIGSPFALGAAATTAAAAAPASDEREEKYNNNA